MPEKYIATAMRKVAIANSNEHLYEVDHVIAGTLDEQKGIMTTQSGEEYSYLLGKQTSDYKAPYYANAILLSEFKKVFKDDPTIYAALDRYKDYCNRWLYYELLKKSGGTALIHIKRADFDEAISQIKENPESYGSSPKTAGTNNTQAESNVEVLEKLGKITDSISESNLSPDELIDLKIRLAEVRREIDEADLAIDMQIEFCEQAMQQASFKYAQPSEEKLPQALKTNTIDIKDMFSKITKTLVAQDRAVRRAVAEISRLCDTPKKDYAILLTGDTGVGKTLLASLLGKYLNRPFLSIDSTQLTIPGFTGKDIEEYLWELYENCGEDLSLAEKAVVYFDEIDKKGSERKNDVSGKGVLDTLLKFMDGVSYSISRNKLTQDKNVRIRTNDMIILAGGAFLEVYSKNRQHQIGFAPSKDDALQQEEPSTTEFVTKGMMTKEFIARTQVIIHLDSLNMTSLKRILLEGDESALKLQRDIFKGKGVILNTQEDYIEGISQRALNSGNGCRGLNKLVLDTTWQAYEEVSLNPGIYKEVILNGETAGDPSKYQLVKRRN